MDETSPEYLAAKEKNEVFAAKVACLAREDGIEDFLLSSVVVVATDRDLPPSKRRCAIHLAYSSEDLVPKLIASCLRNLEKVPALYDRAMSIIANRSSERLMELVAARKAARAPGSGTPMD